MKLIVTVLATGLFYFSQAQYQTASNTRSTQYFSNSIFGGDYPDPSILRDGDTYYIVHSSFQYYPGLQIWQSKDLINWAPVINALHKRKILYMQQ